MEQTYPRFTPDMKKTHKILIPNMAPVQFRILAASMENHGYQVELLGNCGERVAELGLKYVHNDTCYPALLVIGQKTLYPVITGSIFEFGFSDSLLQMFAAFVSELRGLPCSFGCFTPAEAHLSHRVLTAALESYTQKRVVTLE